jgi:chromosome segregation ATPase
MARRPALLLACLAALADPCAAAAAESPAEARLRDALRTTTAQLQAAQDEKARLEATVADQKKELEALRAKLASASACAASTARPRADRELADANRRLAEQAELASRQGADLTQCRADLQRAGDAAAARDAEKAQLTEKLGPLNDRLSECTRKNGKLAEVAGALLARLQKLGRGESVAAREPFLGLKRVELQNLAQDYQDQLLDQKLGGP